MYGNACIWLQVYEYKNTPCVEQMLFCYFLKVLLEVILVCRGPIEFCGESDSILMVPRFGY